MPIAQISQISRNTSGVKLMNLEDKEKIQSVAVFKANEEENHEELGDNANLEVAPEPTSEAVDTNDNETKDNE